MKKYRSFICLILILVLVDLLLIGWNQKKNRVAAVPMTVEAYTVVPGDTLWRIAKGIVGKDKDPRQLIYSIEKINGIGPDIKAGQTIKIPMEGK